MSTLEKAITLLQEMPERKLEAVYMYIRFVDSQDNDEIDSVEKRRKAFEGLMSFAGTLPEDFDYERELEEAREEKYARDECAKQIHADYIVTRNINDFSLSEIPAVTPEELLEMLN